MRILALHEDRRGPGAGGGAESLLRDMAEGLKARGHTVGWWWGEGPIAQAIEDFQPDIVHVQTIHNWIGLGAARFLQENQIPHIWAIMDYYPYCGGRMLLRDAQSCPAVEGVCDGCQPVNPEYLPTVNKSFLVSLNRYTKDIYLRNGMRCDAVVELGVNTEFFHPAKKEARFITTSAWPEFAPKGMHVLSKAIEISGIEVELVAHQPREVVAERLAGASVFVFPSIYQETWGLCLNEAMAAGCACIASDVAGARAQIEPGVTGILVPPNDAEALAKAMQVLHKNEVLQQRLGEAARKHVEADHTLSAMAERWEEVYQEVLNHGWKV